MEKNDVIASLLELPEFEPDRKTVKLPRLNLVLELQEVPYNKLVRIRREEDAQLHLILAAVSTTRSCGRRSGTTTRRAAPRRWTR